MNIELPKTPEQYQKAMSAAEKSCNILMMVAVILVLPSVILAKSASMAYSASEWEEALSLLPWMGLFTGLCLLFAKYAIQENRLYHRARQSMAEDLYAVVKSTGIYDFMDREEFIAGLRKAIFAGDVSAVIDLCEKKDNQDEIAESLEDALEFAEERDCWPNELGYIFPDGANPIQEYITQMAKFDECQCLNSPELMALLWQNSDETQREIWRQVAVSGEWHDIFRVFPEKEFNEFIAKVTA